MSEKYLQRKVSRETTVTVSVTVLKERYFLGEWFGVEWDDVSRGKHSGIHEGVQYFTCSVPNSGSFLRPKKADLGNTFVDAVQEVTFL